MAIEKVHNRCIFVTDCQQGAVRAEGDPEGLPPTRRLLRWDDQPEAAVVKPHLAVEARGGEPTVGRKRDTVDRVAIVRVVEHLAPLLQPVIDAQTVRIGKPGCQIAAVR
jgi:hypothetical protein